MKLRKTIAIVMILALLTGFFNVGTAEEPLGDETADSVSATQANPSETDAQGAGTNTALLVFSFQQAIGIAIDPSSDAPGIGAEVVTDPAGKPSTSENVYDRFVTKADQKLSKTMTMEEVQNKLPAFYQSFLDVLNEFNVLQDHIRYRVKIGDLIRGGYLINAMAMFKSFDMEYDGNGKLDTDVLNKYLSLDLMLSRIKNFQILLNSLINDPNNKSKLPPAIEKLCNAVNDLIDEAYLYFDYEKKQEKGATPSPQLNTGFTFGNNASTQSSLEVGAIVYNYVSKVPDELEEPQ